MAEGFALTLSFDNGPSAEATPLVLDVLARHGIRTTFFVVGERLAQPGARDLTMQAHAQRHWIGNHTWSHSVPLGEQRDAGVAVDEIARTQDLIGNLAHPQKLFRPFGGGGHLDRRLLNAAARDHLIARGYTCVLWNAVPGDWRDPDGWVERALALCRSQPWSLMVLHDLPTGAMRHLDRFLGACKTDGAVFRQEFPPDCVPMRTGEILLPLARYVTA